ncbi:MAG: ribosome silencing factor [Bradymonadaceae bacterium]
MKKENASKKTQEELTDEELLDVARGLAELTWDLKALNTIVIDLRGRVSYTDFVIVTTGTSERHVQAIARRLETAMREAHRKPLGTEGIDQGRWALLDFGDIIVHIFHQEARGDYNLERMWVEAPRLEFEDKPNDLYGHFEMEQFTP